MSNQQFFSFTLQKPNPISTGFLLDFKAYDANQHPLFSTGIARYELLRPSIAASGLTIEGLNSAVESMPIIDQINFNLKIDGGVPNNFEDSPLGDPPENNSGALNVEKVSIFTGKTVEKVTGVAPDRPNFEKSTVADASSEINFSLTKEELNGNTGEIFYTVLPFDRLGSGTLSEPVSQRLFTGFDEVAAQTDEIFISRTNLNDLRFANQRVLLTENATKIEVDHTGILSNFICGLEIRHDKPIDISGTTVDVTFINPPDISEPTTGVTISGEFKVFSLSKDSINNNLYIVRDIS